MATLEERCITYKKQRRALYSRRSYLLNTQNSSKRELRKRELNELENIPKKVEKFNEKIFKCGKTYQKLKKKKVSLQGKSRRLKKKAGDVTIDAKQRRLILKEITYIAEEIDIVKKAMNMKTVERAKDLKKGTTVNTDEGYIRVTTTVWELRDEVENYLKGTAYNTLDIDGQMFFTNEQDLIDIELTSFAIDIEANQFNRQMGYMVDIYLYQGRKHISLVRD